MMIIFAIFLGIFSLANVSHAATYYVSSGNGNDRNPGTQVLPLATINKAVNLAQSGDEIVIRNGTYGERVTTLRSGVTLKAFPGETVIVSQTGNALDINHASTVIDSIIFDAGWGSSVAATVTNGNNLIIRNSEIRNTKRDCLDISNTSGVLIENSRIHHCLRWESGRVDAHGITGSQLSDITVRNSEIYQFSGDAIQLTPDRSPWDMLVIEGSTFWLAPLPESIAGFPQGAVSGENALDTKTPSSGSRSRVTIRDSRFYGFGGAITVQGALNIKENVVALIERSLVHDSEIAFRLRFPALVTLQSNVVYENQTAIRYEDGISDLSVLNNTFGSHGTQFFQKAGSGTGTNLRFINNLFLSSSLPTEAPSSRSNLATGSSSFRNISTDDYHLTSSSRARDAGATLTEVTTDKDRVSRPQASAYDIGAYEYVGDTADTTPSAAPANLRIQ